MSEQVTIFLSIFGIVLGFTLGEGSRIVREIIQIDKMKKSIYNELITLKSQINDHKQNLNIAIDYLKKSEVIPLKNVRSISIGYNSYINTIYKEFSVVERNCLHVIYERLRVADELQSSYHDEVQNSISNQSMDNPLEYYVGRLEDLIRSYDVVYKLINSYLNSNAEDVFKIKKQISDA